MKSQAVMLLLGLAGAWSANADPIPLGTRNGHSYFIVDAGTVTQARAAAHGIATSYDAPAYLATINDAAEETWILQNLPDPLEQFWIGLSDEVVEGTFVWDNGEPVAYTHFVLAEPTDFGFCPTTNQTCACEDNVTVNGHPVTGGGWNDLAGDCWNIRGLVELEDMHTSARPQSWGRLKLIYR